MSTVQQRNRVTIGSNGKPVFFIDNKIVKRSDYEEIVGKYVDPVEAPREPLVDKCPVCPANSETPTTRQKFLNGTKINLCEEHYTRCTTGEIAAAMRG